MYEVGGIGEPFNLSLPERSEALGSLPQPLPISFTVLEEKFLGRTVHEGRLAALSECEAGIESALSLVPLSNLKIELKPVAGANPGGEIYAKVIGAVAGRVRPDPNPVHFPFSRAEGLGAADGGPARLSAGGDGLKLELQTASTISSTRDKTAFVQETKPPPTLADLLGVLLENKGSDLHVQSGEVPIGRINGELGRFEMPALTESDVLRLAREALGSDEKMQEFQATKDCDAAIAIPNLGRFRVNLFYQRNRPGLVLRTIGTKIPTIEQLELPEVLKTIAAANDGLVLVTGATGSGKSTTLAALIDHINATEACHIMTLEDPIEFVHENKLALINQREIAVDSSTFASALKHVLRQDPDVILIGEMRDSESASVALTAAETGHLVFGTLHTQDAPESLERLINLFPTDRIAQVRMQLSLGLRAIICQKLLPRAEAGGRPPWKF